MGETTLVEGLVEDSAEFVKQLDACDLKPALAVWYFYEDADEWRFLIAGPEFDKFLPKQEALAYQKIAEIISSTNLDSLSISYVKIISTDNPLVKTLKFLIGTGADGIIKAHFSDTTINGIFIKEMVVIRSS